MATLARTMPFSTVAHTKIMSRRAVSKTPNSESSPFCVARGTTYSALKIANSALRNARTRLPEWLYGEKWTSWMLSPWNAHSSVNLKRTKRTKSIALAWGRRGKSSTLILRNTTPWERAYCRLFIVTFLANNQNSRSSAARFWMSSMKNSSSLSHPISWKERKKRGKSLKITSRKTRLRPRKRSEASLEWGLGTTTQIPWQLLIWCGGVQKPRTHKLRKKTHTWTRIPLCQRARGVCWVVYKWIKTNKAFPQSKRR